MKVAIFPSDKGGCGMYRMYWPGQALFAKGFDVREYPRPQLLNDGKRVLGLAQPLDVDVVVFQRPARQAYIMAFEYFQSIGIKVVVDMDDNLSCIHPKNPAYLPYNQVGPGSGDMHYKWAEKACEIADLVTVTTPALAEHYGKNGNAVIIPNFIPERYLEVAKPVNELVTVGWAGHVATHPEDLKVTHGSINQALADTKDKSRFFACDEKAFQELAVRKRLPHVLTEGVPINLYPNLLAHLDIGIVPLDNSAFNEAKSWLKGLEYAACGVAPVLSPTPDNMRLVAAGAALSASGPREWLENTKLLIKDDAEREALAKRAREFASTQTIEGNCERWWEAWSSI